MDNMIEEDYMIEVRERINKRMNRLTGKFILEAVERSRLNRKPTKAEIKYGMTNFKRKHQKKKKQK